MSSDWYAKRPRSEQSWKRAAPMTCHLSLRHGYRAFIASSTLRKPGVTRPSQRYE